MKRKHLILIAIFGSAYSLSVMNNISFAFQPFKEMNPDVNQSLSASADAIRRNTKGIAYLTEGYPLHAIDEFKIALMLNPNSYLSATVYNNLGKAYETIKRYDLAIMSYEHAIRINPDFSPYYKNLVKVYKRKNVIPKAEKEYQEVIKVNSYDSKAYYTLGLIYLEQGKKNDAKNCFNKFITIEPEADLTASAKKYITKIENGSY